MSFPQFFPAEQLSTLTPDKGIILDVRSGMEHEEKRLFCPHVHVPLDTLDAKVFMTERHYPDHFSVYIVCRSGQRSAQAADKFLKAGYGNVFVVTGGLQACEACGQALSGYAVGGEDNHAKSCAFLKRPVSLERQVRMTAGLFIVVGVLLALIFNPAFIGIPLFVGCGLIFAGVTDRCGMMLVLTKAPWNQKYLGKGDVK